MSEIMLSRMLDAVDVGVMILDESLTIQFWNGWLSRQTNVSCEEAVYSPITKLYPQINSRTLKRRIMTTLMLESPTYYTAADPPMLSIPRSNITNPVFNEMQQTVTLLPFDTEQRTVLVIIQDNTTLREAQTQLEIKLNQLKDVEIGYLDIIDSHVLMLKANKQGNIIYASQAYCDLIGKEKDDILGGSIGQFLDDISLFKPAMGEESKEANKEFSFVITDYRGRKLHLKAKIDLPSPNAPAHLQVFTAVMQDITNEKRLETMAITDSLTKLYNRNKFNDAIGEHAKGSTRYDYDLSLCIFDIDHFKAVNDTYGHNVGDAVLTEMADILRKQMRDTDVYARWGGEEFIMLLPHTPLDAAKQVADRLRLAVENHSFPTVPKVTSSFGVAGFIPYEEPKDFIARADAALYAAKESGRNRVEVSD